MARRSRLLPCCPQNCQVGANRGLGTATLPGSQLGVTVWTLHLFFFGGGVTKLTPVLAPPASTRDRFQEGAMLFGILLPTSPPCPWLLEHGAAEQSRHREFRLVKDSHVCGRRGDFFLSSLKSVKEDICHPNICTFCGR